MRSFLFSKFTTIAEMNISGTESPIGILYDSNQDKVGYLYFLGGGTIPDIIKGVGYFLAAISIMGLIICIFLERNPNALTEHKRAIAHKLYIVFLISSITTLMDLVLTICRNIFFS